MFFCSLAFGGCMHATVLCFDYFDFLHFVLTVMLLVCKPPTDAHNEVSKILFRDTAPATILFALILFPVLRKQFLYFVDRVSSNSS